MSETHYETTNLALFLQRFDDQALANFQAATEDNRIEDWNPCHCVIGYFNHNAEDLYMQTKHSSGYDEAPGAEIEFIRLCMENRHDILLELIAAEWERRRVPTDEEKLDAVRKLALGQL